MNTIQVEGKTYRKAQPDELCSKISDCLYYNNNYWILEEKEEYKVGDWIIYITENGTMIRRIISDREYIDSNLIEEFKVNYGDENWMTFAAVKHQIKNILRKAASEEIKKHLAKLAVEKGFTKGSTIFIDSNEQSLVKNMQEYDNYDKSTDTYAKSNINLYSNGKWLKLVKHQQFTFGGEDILFDVNKITKNVYVWCKGEKGTHIQIANILSHYLKPLPFGNVLVKKFTITSPFHITSIPIHICNNLNNKPDIIHEISIGCVTGTYKELQDIYQHCLKLLKMNYENNR